MHLLFIFNGCFDKLVSLVPWGQEAYEDNLVGAGFEVSTEGEPSSAIYSQCDPGELLKLCVLHVDRQGK